jgi:tetratricopeptide (TPR) repeat protein
VGIETAVVTIPGHIYMAFALDLPPEQAVTVLGSRDMFLFKNGKAWVPVETTMITDSFYNAWKEGARESDPASQPDLAFYPIHEAWKAFAPIVVSSDAPVPAVPATATLAAALDNGLRSLVRAELEPRAAALKAEIANAANPAKATNSLALLYARYGQYDQATSILETLIAKQPYGPAYVNLGNIHLIEKEYQQALDRYQSWLAVNPVEPLAIAGQALAYDGLGDRAKAREAFTKLADLDKKLAQKYAYLNSADSDSGGRAAEIGQLDGVLSWKEGTE